MIIVAGKEYEFDGIVFLDMDGVLNSQDFFVQRSWDFPGKEYLARLEGEDDDQYYARRHVDPKAVAILNILLEKTNFGIVLSSTWRSCEHTRTSVKHAGIKDYDRRLVGYTPLHIKGTSLDRRGNEIMAWIQKVNYRGKFVILDDDSDMGHLKDYLVKTHCAHGLTAFIAHLVLWKLERNEFPTLTPPEDVVS